MMKQGLLLLSITLGVYACGGGTGSMTPDANKPGLVLSPNELTTPIDPVCRMDMTNFKITDTVHHAGGIYPFCSGHCKRMFKDAPADYLTVAE